MLRDDTVTIQWKPSTSGGALGDEVDVTMLRDDVTAMRDRWRAIDQLPTGAAKTQALIEFRILMDTFATFAGTEIHHPEPMPVIEGLRDPAGGSYLRDVALDRVDFASTPVAKEEALRAIRAAAAEKPTITADDVWVRMQVHPEEPRMLGPVMKHAVKLGLIAYTEETVRSELPQNHRRPVRVWRSLMFDAQQRIAS